MSRPVLFTAQDIWGGKYVPVTVSSKIYRYLTVPCLVLRFDRHRASADGDGMDGKPT